MGPAKKWLGPIALPKNWPEQGSTHVKLGQLQMNECPKRSLTIDDFRPWPKCTSADAKRHPEVHPVIPAVQVQSSSKSAFAIHHSSIGRPSGYPKVADYTA